MKELTEIFEETMTNFDWNTTLHDTATGISVFLEQCTPAGEDWCIDYDAQDMDDAINYLIEYPTTWDINEEVNLWSASAGINGVPDIETLVEDAKWKKSILDQCANALKSIKMGMIETPKPAYYVPIEATFYGFCKVEADSKEEALRIAKANIDAIPFPEYWPKDHYVEDSMDIVLDDPEAVYDEDHPIMLTRGEKDFAVKIQNK